MFVFSENPDIELELLNKGRELADKSSTELSTLAFSEEEAKDLIEHGADLVFTAEKPSNYYAEIYAELIALLAKEHGLDPILIGGTKRGKETAPRVAAKLGAGSAADCFDLDITDGNLVVKRRVYSGNSVATIRFRKKPQIATVPAMSFEKAERTPGRVGKIEKVDFSPKEPGREVKGFKEKVQEGIKIEDAQFIVSGGRGLKAKADFSLIKEFADAIGGEMGCSRPIASDLKWVSEDHWVGLSGHKVKPKIYIACGISGQVQHLAGMRDSGTIMAINKNADAPIFKVADYGIVGDLYKVIPQVIEALKKSS
jgi:electron transfer flavoprotein alpha subunit